MLKRTAVIVWLLYMLGLNSLNGQQYVLPNKYKIGNNEHVVIKSDADLSYMKKHIKQFFGIDNLRLDGDADISNFASIVDILGDIEQVELINFKGQLLDEDIAKFDWVGEVLVTILAGQENHILNTNYLQKMNSLVLVFEVVPGDWDFLKTYTCRSLKIIAPFVEKQVPAAIDAASSIKYLREFGISLDKVKHLSKNITKIKRLEKLILIDNLSWITEKDLGKLASSTFNLEQSIEQGLYTRYYTVNYLANNDELTDYDKNHLLGIFGNTQIVPFINSFNDSGAYARFAQFVPLNRRSNAQFQPLFEYNHIIKNDMESEMVFEGSNQQDRIYFIQDKAAIFVPKNSLQSQFDTNFLGSYQLRISFNNQIRQFFASSNTLRFDSGGRNYNLAPSAMIEIQAQDGWRILNLKPGYFIKVVFMGKIDTADVFYAYSRAKKVWENWWDYDYEFNDLKNQKIDFYQFYGGKKTAKLVSDINSIIPTQHFETYGYYYHLPSNLSKMNLSKQGKFYMPSDNTTGNIYGLRKGKKYVSFARFTKYQKENIIALKLGDKTGVLFPELKSFTKVPLFIETPMSARAFNEEFISKKRYYDVQFEQNGNRYFLNLKTDNGYWHFTLSQPNELDKPGIKQGKFYRAYKKYNSTYLQRMRAWQESQLKIESNFAESVIDKLLNNSSQTSEFKIRSLGAFTWAHPVISDDTFNVIIKPTTDGGVPIVAKRFIVAQKVPFTYQSFEAQKTYSVSLNYKNLQYLVCIDDKDQVYLLNGKDFNSMGIKNNTYIELPMKELPQPIDDISILNKLLEIKK